MSHLSTWGMSLEDVDAIISDNPSLRGMLFGYFAEHMLTRELSARYSELLVDAGKPADHDRSNKGDRLYRYGGFGVRIECKSLKTSTLQYDETGAPVSAKVQCDASDCRDVVMGDGSTVRTTCLKVGEFDIVAVNMFAMFDEWRFAYAANRELPRTLSPKYTPEQRKELLATSVDITAELAAPFTWDLGALVARLADEGHLGAFEQARVA
jgi:hypothetical protein